MTTGIVPSRLGPTKVAVLGILLFCTITPSQELPQVGDTMPPGTIQAYAVSDDGHLGVVADYDGNLLLLNLRSGQIETLVSHYPFAVNELVVSPRLAFVAFTHLGEAVWVSLTNPSHLLRKIELGPEIQVGGLSVSPDGGYLAGVSSDVSSVLVWNLEKGVESTRLRHCSGGQQFSAFSPDGHQVAAVCDENIVRIWEIDTSLRVRDLSVGSGAFVNCIQFSKDGRRLFAATGRTNLVQVFDVNTGAIAATLKGHTDQVYSFAVQTNGQVITASADETVRVWNLKTSKLLRTLNIPDARIAANGSVVLARSEQPGALDLWDVRTGRKVRTFNVRKHQKRAKPTTAR